MKKINKCRSCGIVHKKVVCSGLWYCPNSLCEGPGSGYFRSKLKSYKEISDYKNMINIKEWWIKGCYSNLIRAIFIFKFKR